MKKVVAITLFVFIGSLLSSCVTEATEKEYKDMCENLVRLRGKIDSTPLDHIIAKIEKEYQLRAKTVKDQLNREIMAWDELFKEDLSTTKDEKEKERLIKEDAEFRANINKKYAKEIEKLAPEKQRELRKAKEKVEEAELNWTEAVDQCLSSSQQEKVPKEVAKCRISAESTDKYWNSCR